MYARRRLASASASAGTSLRSCSAICCVCSKSNFICEAPLLTALLPALQRDSTHATHEMRLRDAEALRMRHAAAPPTDSPAAVADVVQVNVQLPQTLRVDAIDLAHGCHDQCDHLLY